jgi:hypothetical protein
MKCNHTIVKKLSIIHEQTNWTLLWCRSCGAIKYCPAHTDNIKNTDINHKKWIIPNPFLTEEADTSVI